MIQLKGEMNCLLTSYETTRVTFSWGPPQLMESRYANAYSINDHVYLSKGTLLLHLGDVYNGNHYFVLCPDGVIALIGYYNCTELSQFT